MISPAQFNTPVFSPASSMRLLSPLVNVGPVLFFFLESDAHFNGSAEVNVSLTLSPMLVSVTYVFNILPAPDNTSSLVCPPGRVSQMLLSFTVLFIQMSQHN
jgi:hypothetical protein